MKAKYFSVFILVIVLIGGGIWCYRYAQDMALKLAESSIEKSRESGKQKFQEQQEEASRKREQIENKIASVQVLFEELTHEYGYRPSTLEWGCKTPTGICAPLTAPPKTHLTIHKAAWSSFDSDTKSLLIDYAKYKSLDGIILVLPQNGRVLIEKQAWER